jgi:hypothetical protein
LVLYSQCRAVHHADKSNSEIHAHKRCTEEAKHQQQRHVQPPSFWIVQGDWSQNNQSFFFICNRAVSELRNKIICVIIGLLLHNLVA